MKKLIVRSVVALAAALSIVTVAQAQGSPQAAPTSLDYVLYNSTVAASGAAISVGPLNTANAEAVTFNFVNTGAGARSAIIECWDPTNTVTTVIFPTVTVGATTAATVVQGIMATGTAPSTYTFLATLPCHRTSVRAAAATGSMQVIVLKRTGR